MNIVLTRKTELGHMEFYLAAVKRSGDVFIAVSKRITKDGRLEAHGPGFNFSTETEANRKVRDLVKIKMKKQDWKPIDLEKLPAPVVAFLEVPPEMQVTPEELVIILRDAQKERYVIFSDVVGLEQYFDAGVQYIGYVVDDDLTIKVFDKTGILRDCFTKRFSSVEFTERAVEAKALKDTVGRQV
jgi:hypothetical protein